MVKIKRALISVSDKTNIIDLARSLKLFNIEILSTGGTAALLSKNNIEVIEVSDYTEFPEMLDGRVKTLHPKIHGGILGIRANPTHEETMKNYNIKPIDLVVVNLYPFESTTAKPECLIDEAIENIDIGGPAMIRSAAKNYKDVAVLTNPNSYEGFIHEITKNKALISEEFRFKLAQKAFEHTSKYDSAINQYLQSKMDLKSIPDQITKVMNKKLEMRYGENPHQTAVFFTDPIVPKG